MRPDASRRPCRSENSSHSGGNGHEPHRTTLEHATSCSPSFGGPSRAYGLLARSSRASDPSSCTRRCAVSRSVAATPTSGSTTWRRERRHKKVLGGGAPLRPNERATTIRRMVLERATPPDLDPVHIERRRSPVVARYPGHTWHVDLTVVPTRAGFWVPWFPFSLPQRWPFCWWVAVVVDQVSRAVMGLAVFPRSPSSDQIQRFLDRAIRDCGRSPEYVVTDKGRHLLEDPNLFVS
jgi:transposase InsO family protein